MRFLHILIPSFSPNQSRDELGSINLSQFRILKYDNLRFNVVFVRLTWTWHLIFSPHICGSSEGKQNISF